MTRVTLDVERLVLETDAVTARAPGLPDRVRRTLEHVAHRLQESRLTTGAEALEIGRLELTSTTAADLLAPGGDERLADLLYGRLVAAVDGRAGGEP